MIARNEGPVGLWTWISLSVRHGLRSSGVQAGRDLGAEWFPRLSAQQNHRENFRSVQVPGLSFRSRGSQVCILEPSQAILNNWSMDRLLGTTALANICSNSLAVHRRKLRPKEAVAFAQIPHGLSGGARNELEIICFSEVVKFSVVPDARARF